MSDEEMVRVMHLVCGLNRKPGKDPRRIGGLAMVNGRLWGPTVGRLKYDNGPEWLVAPCPEHGLLKFRESDAIEAYRRKQKALELTERDADSFMRTRRRKN